MSFFQQLQEATVNTATLFALATQQTPAAEGYTPVSCVCETRSNGTSNPTEITSSMRDSLEQYVATSLRAVSGVEHIFTRIEGNCLRLWVVIPDASETLEGRIYDAYMAILPRVQFEVDLTVVFRRSRPVRSVMPVEAREILPT